MVTAAPMVGFDLHRTAADAPLRRKLKQLGSAWFTERVVTEWSGDRATVRDLHAGAESHIDADALVLATTNTSNDSLTEELVGSESEVHAVGDCVAPRTAAMAIYEGRQTGMRL